MLSFIMLKKEAFFLYRLGVNILFIISITAATIDLYLGDTVQTIYFLFSISSSLHMPG